MVEITRIEVVGQDVGASVSAPAGAVEVTTTNNGNETTLTVEIKPTEN